MMNQELERAFQYLLKGEDKELLGKLTDYIVEEKDQKYSDFFALFSDYLKALEGDLIKGAVVSESVVEIQTKTKTHLEAARLKAMGPKQKPK
jgi:hypothetical protein